jgi:HSP20 family molecular chaperone IbpA
MRTKEAIMEATQDVAKVEGAAPQRQRHGDLAVPPPVDIFEDPHGIMVIAEMPGVSKDRLHVHADRNTLTIEGEAAIEMPQGMEPVHADLKATRYSRSFVLSGELETDAIDAKLKDGVLTIRIPKRREYRPRKIEVRTG